VIETELCTRAPRPGGYRKGRRPKMLTATSTFAVEIDGERITFKEGRDQVRPDWEGFRERPGIRSRFAPQDSTRARAAVERASQHSGRRRQSSSPRLGARFSRWRLPTSSSSASWRLTPGMSLAEELRARKRALRRLS
jgi:hypothetical protein